jgi:polyisoprenyl-phosphate glycosyltransferase
VINADAPRFSVVLPVHNERDSLHQLFERLLAVLEGVGEPWEVVFVDDGSTDGSFTLMVQLNRRDRRFKAIQLSRNFGHQVALTAGLDAASGDAVIVMDADLQHPPEAIPDFVAKWREGYEVVYGIREERTGEPWLKRTTARVFYRVLGTVSETKMPANAGDFRLVDRSALEAFRSLREANRYIRGMFAWVGFRQTGLPYAGVERGTGTTKYSFGRMLKLGIDGILSFSSAPLRLVLHTGLLVSLLSLGIFVYALVSKITGGAALPGWASLLAVTAFLGGIQLLTLGTVGLYVGRIYEEVKARPLYLVREQCGIGGTSTRRQTKSFAVVESGDP